jgi:hypothetical protein
MKMMIWQWKALQSQQNPHQFTSMVLYLSLRRIQMGPLYPSMT